MIEIKNFETLEEVGKKGNDGYVVNSVPLVIAAASKVKIIGVEEMFIQLIKIGGDTDTNCSIAGQIVGALVGYNQLPQNLKDKLEIINEYKWILSTIEKCIQYKEW